MIEADDSRSLASSISGWLDELPCVHSDYDAYPTVPKRLRGKRKRYQEPQKQLEEAPDRKSRRLTETSGNAMRRRSPRKPKNRNPVTPSKEMRPQQTSAPDLVRLFPLLPIFCFEAD